MVEGKGMGSLMGHFILSYLQLGGGKGTSKKKSRFTKSSEVSGFYKGCVAKSKQWLI